MSFLGGPECSAAGNPLTQFAKHVQNDNSLQRDRLIGYGSERQHESIRSQESLGQQDEVQLALASCQVGCQRMQAYSASDDE